MNFINISLDLLGGFLVTCEIFAVTLILSIPLGLIITFCSMSKFIPLKAISRGIVWVIRGTPLMLQVIAVYYGPALLFGWGILPRMLAVLVAFVINYSCYFSEIYRGGIDGVPRGQTEAGLALGMSRTQIFFKILLMQVIKRIVAPMGNEIITLVKDTSLARVIVIAEILKIAQEYTARGLIWPLFYTAVYYLIFVGLLTLLFRYTEKKLSYMNE